LQLEEQKDEVQKNVSETKKPVEKVEEKDPVEEKVLDFVNEIKNQALQNSYEQAGFIYEPTSGLYW
jgi:hypothetical protein